MKGADVMKKRREGSWANPHGAGYEKKRPVRKVDRREWAMFQDCPKEELPWCWWYEFIRESFLKHRMTREEFLGGYLISKCDPSLVHLIRLFPEFPETCWLAVPQRARQKRLTEMWPIRSRGGNRAVEWHERQHNIKGQRKRICGSRPSTHLLAGLSVLRRSKESLQKEREAQQPDQQYEPEPYDANMVWKGKDRRVSCHILRLDWSLSDNHLVEAFRGLVWFLRRVEWGGGGFKPRGKAEARRKDSEHTDLKALAAKRLLDSGMTASDAVNYTEKELGKALYAEKLFHRRAAIAKKIVARVKPCELGEPSVWEKMPKKVQKCCARSLVQEFQKIRDAEKENQQKEP